MTVIGANVVFQLYREKAQGFNRILTTKVDKTSKYDVTEDGLIIWNDATIPLS